MKSRFLTVAGLALAAAAFCGPLAAQSFPSAHWKSKVRMEGGPQGDMTTDSEIWMKDKSMRMKTLAMGMNVNIIKSGDFMYQWQEGQTTGMKMPANMRRGGGSDYVNKIDEVRAKGKKIGTYVGRVAVKTAGYFKITGSFGMVEGIHGRYCSPIHRHDGYAYRKGEAVLPPHA